MLPERAVLPMKKESKDPVTKRTTARYAALDALIIVLLLLCVAGVGIRVALGEDGLATGRDRGTYAVSFIVTGAKSEYSEYFNNGEEFRLADGRDFGALSGNAIITPAKIYRENSNGEYIVRYSSGDTFDIKGTALVEGAMTDSGFLLNCTQYIAANMQLSVSSRSVTCDILITDISKAS